MPSAGRVLQLLLIVEADDYDEAVQACGRLQALFGGTARSPQKRASDLSGEKRPIHRSACR